MLNGKLKKQGHPIAGYFGDTETERDEQYLEMEIETHHNSQVKRKAGHRTERK